MFLRWNVRVRHVKEKRKPPWQRKIPLEAGVMMHKGYDRGGS